LRVRLIKQNLWNRKPFKRTALWNGKEVIRMPSFDGTGPRGLGPMTGRGEGYCAIVLPSSGTRRAPYGYAGLAGVPVRMNYPYGRAPAYGPVLSPVEGSVPSVVAAPYALSWTGQYRAPAPYSGGRPRWGMRSARGRGRGRGLGPSSRPSIHSGHRSGRGRRRW
jgi:hypothetical protein